MRLRQPSNGKMMVTVMRSLIYPRQEIWVPKPFLQRWRNSSGERIRLADGKRMNDTECCCDTADCAYCSGTVPSSLSVTIAGMANNPSGPCDVSNDCTVFNGTYTADFTTYLPGVYCQWLYDPDPAPLYCDSTSESPAQKYFTRLQVRILASGTLQVQLIVTTAIEEVYSNGSVSSDCDSWSSVSLAAGGGSSRCNDGSTTCTVTAL